VPGCGMRWAPWPRRARIEKVAPGSTASRFGSEPFVAGYSAAFPYVGETGVSLGLPRRSVSPSACQSVPDVA
jgi:hypothetical protein